MKSAGASNPGNFAHCTSATLLQIGQCLDMSAAKNMHSTRPPCCAGWRPAQVAVKVNGSLNVSEGSTGWSVEMALPWSLLQQAANRQTPPAHGEE